ncbi:unnamed protein product [Effrenium voratum]|nr:unnamed protein product [Effrenium voratum]
MQNPGEQVAELAQQGSISALLARFKARHSAKAAPPFGARKPVESSESGRGYTLGREYPTMGTGTLVPSLLAPIGVTLTFCVLVGKSLHRMGK